MWLSFLDPTVTMPEIEETTETAAETAELAKANAELEAKRTGAWKVSTPPPHRPLSRRTPPRPSSRALGSPCPASLSGCGARIEHRRRLRRWRAACLRGGAAASAERQQWRASRCSCASQGALVSHERTSSPPAPRPDARTPTAVTRRRRRA